jgi:hypothetical protein
MIVHYRNRILAVDMDYLSKCAGFSIELKLTN